MTHPIIAEARDAYLATTKNELYERGSIWSQASPNFKNLSKIIAECETPDAVIAALEQTDMYAIRIRNRKVFDLMMKWHLMYCAQKEGAMIADQIDTPNLVKMCIYCMHIMDDIGKDNMKPPVPIILAQTEEPYSVKSILEIGGGNGQFARIAKWNLKPITHYDVDIPETLYMAHVCLQHWFPDAKFLWVTDHDDLFNVSDGDYDFVFVPTAFAHVLEGRKFSIVVNTASMGEMSNEWIRYWMKFIQEKINVDYLYFFNRYLNTVSLDPDDVFSVKRLGENEASVLFDKKWKVMRWEVEPIFARCPYEDPKIARYLELFLKRTSEDQNLPDDMIDSLREEDWFVCTKGYVKGTHRSNQLCLDLTPSGTLFKLWESVRLAPSSVSVGMMLSYLQEIKRTELCFEEEFYYKKLYERIEGKEFA